LPGLRPASLSPDTSPAAGTAVDIAYWNDATNQVDVYSTNILYNDGVHKSQRFLAVNMGVINPGDSGGGLFVNNQYVANAWFTKDNYPNPENNPSRRDNIAAYVPYK
jgi:hypothetical protein